MNCNKCKSNYDLRDNQKDQKDPAITSIKLFCTSINFINENMRLQIQNQSSIQDTNGQWHNVWSFCIWSLVRLQRQLFTQTIKHSEKTWTQYRDSNPNTRLSSARAQAETSGLLSIRSIATSARAPDELCCNLIMHKSVASQSATRSWFLRTGADREQCDFSKPHEIRGAVWMSCSNQWHSICCCRICARARWMICSKTAFDSQSAICIYFEYYNSCQSSKLNSRSVMKGGFRAAIKSKISYIVYVRVI